MAERPPAHYNLDELRNWLKPRLEKPGGVRCPVCLQHAQAYKRKVTQSMVSVMGRMLRVQNETQPELDPRAAKKADRAYETDEFGKRWIHLPHIEQASRDATMLAYWKLIVEWSVFREDGGRAGFWRVTDRGEQFLRGTYRIDTYAHVYRGEVYGFSGPQIDVLEVAPKFDLRQLMEGV